MNAKRCGKCGYEFRPLDTLVHVRERFGSVLCERCFIEAPIEVTIGAVSARVESVSSYGGNYQCP